MQVNYIQHLSCFFFRSERTSGMRPPHVSLYMALFRQWNALKFCEIMPVSRAHLMLISKIGSKDCYHRSMKQLHALGFIHYYPSQHPREQARVAMQRLDVPAAQPALRVFDDIPAKREPDMDPVPGRFSKTIQTKENITAPALAGIIGYFADCGWPDADALKFFNYYESIGWLQGGRVPIVNWKAAACKWMLDKKSVRKFKRPDNSDNPQDYGTPL